MREKNAAGNPLAQEFGMAGLLRFAFPTTVMMVFMGLYTMVDTVFVSRLVNTDALAAMNIVCPAVNLMVGLGTMLAAGGNAVLSRTMGQGKEEEARRSFTLLIVSGCMLGFLLAGIGLFRLELLVRALGAGGRLEGYCTDYLGILFCFFPAGILQTMFSNLFVTAGRPGLGSMLSVGAGILNLVLDYVFMEVCNMGIGGAALGTGCGYLLPAAAGLVFFTKSRGVLRFSRPEWDFRILAESCLNGSSELVSQVAAAMTTFLFNRVMLKLAGEDAVAAITMMMYAQFLFHTGYIGFSMGAAPVIGYAFGSGEKEKLKKLVRTCLRVVAVSSVAIFAFVFFGGKWMVECFVGSAPGVSAGISVYELARKGFPIFGVSFLFCGINIFTSAMFTALSDGKTSAMLSFLRTFVFLTMFILLFSRLWGVTGVWLAVPAAEGAAFVLSVGCLVRFWIGR